MEKFNPLFDKLPGANKVSVEAAREPHKIPVSPYTGKRMTEAKCGDIPCFVDLDTKSVYPVMSEG